MTLQWIPLDALVPHPENSNRMPPRLLVKLKGHIERTGLYEPLVVRPLTTERGARNAECGANGDSSPAFPVPSPESPVPPLPSVSAPHSACRAPSCQYQILNGHHRAQVLRELGHTHARCDVWEVDDREARVLLATLNRLEGRDDPSARASLVAGLSDGKSPKDLAALLPEPTDAVERLLKLAAPPPAPLAAEDLPPLPRPMTFFLTEEQHALVSEALREAGHGDASLAAHLDGRVSKGVRSSICKAPDPLAVPAVESEGVRRLTDRAPDPGVGHTRPPLEGEGAGVRGAVVACSQQQHPSPGLRPPSPARGEGEPRRAAGATLSRAERLERLALWYLEARNLR